MFMRISPLQLQSKSLLPPINFFLRGTVAEATGGYGRFQGWMADVYLADDFLPEERRGKKFMDLALSVTSSGRQATFVEIFEGRDHSSDRVNIYTVLPGDQFNAMEKRLDTLAGPLPDMTLDLFSPDSGETEPSGEDPVFLQDSSCELEIVFGNR